MLSPSTGEPLGLLVPPYNVDSGGAGMLAGLAVDEAMLYVTSTLGPCRVIGLPREPAKLGIEVE